MVESREGVKGRNEGDTFDLSGLRGGMFRRPQEESEQTWNLLQRSR